MRVTASKVGLLEECQWWATPGAEWPTETSDAADLGTRFHAAIESYVAFGEMPAHTDDIAQLLVSAKAWVDHFGREKLAAEVAFAWDPEADTAKVLGHGLGRDYSSGDGLLCGSADLIAVSRFTKTGYVGDWSTGDGSKKGPQLRTLALMLARAEGLESVTVEALEVSAEGVRHVCTETLDEFALAAIAGEIAESLVIDSGVRPQPGAHCTEMYCPARVTCPAAREIVDALIPAESLVRPGWGLVIANPDHARWLLDHARLVGAAVEAVKDAVKAYVPKDGLVLEDGSMLVEGTRNMPRRDYKKLEMLARTMGATDEQIAGCDYLAVESSGLRVKKLKAAAKPRKKKAA